MCDTGGQSISRWTLTSPEVSTVTGKEKCLCVCVCVSVHVRER